MKNHQKGFLSIIAILLAAVVLIISVAATYHALNDTREATNSLNSSNAFYIAQSGIEYAKHLIRNNTQTCGTNIGNTTPTGYSGIFSVTTTLNGTQCTLVSTGSAYTSGTTTITATRTIQAVLTSSGIAPAPIIASGPISLTGNATVTNFSVNANNANYVGSTIISNSTVTIGGSANTAVTGLNPSSSSSSINSDVIQNDSAITSSNLSSQFFSIPLSTITATATQITKENQLNSAPGGTYYSNGDLKLVGNDTVGSAANPAILIITGDLDIKGTLTFYGLIYVTGNLTISGNANITGAVAAGTSITKTTGNAIITFDTSVLNNAHNTNSNTVIHYDDAPLTLTEVIT